MASKKYLIVAFVISAGVAFGVFSFAPASKIFYIKNNSANYLAGTDIQQPAASQTNGKIGNLSNNIIPPIKVTQNITENFAAALTKNLIAKNENPGVGDLLPGPGVSMPDPNKIAEDFISNGLQQANENILNINPPNFTISYDNSKSAIETYLTEAQAIISSNLPANDSLYSILDEINKNNGAGVERLLPIAAAHEAAASQLEQAPVPSSLKDLMTQEIKLLRITANILRALTNVENDPLGAMAATQQFTAALQSWQDLQTKFDAFIQKFNTAQ